MIRTETRALRILNRGGRIRRTWGGWKIEIPGEIRSDSILPRLVTELAESGAIERVDDRTSCVGEEWRKVSKRGPLSGPHS